MYEIIYAYIILTSIRKKKTHHIVMGQSPLLSENRKYFLNVQGSNHFG